MTVPATYLSRRVLPWIAGLLLAAGFALLAGGTGGPPSAEASHSGAGGGDCSPVTGSPNGRDPRAVNPRSANPLAGLRFFVDHDEQSYGDYQRYLAAGQRQKAEWVGRIANRPRFKWMGRFTKPGGTANFIRRVACQQPGSVPEIVTLRHQGKQCNPRYTAGGRAEDERTKAWFHRFAREVGNARVVIGFEPDSIGTIGCLARSRRAARKRVLRYGVDVLSKLPNATIYLEGTASDWKSPRYVARMLRYMGIHKVRGFMLNVTHYDWTSANIRFGRKVSRRVGGKPFIVSTSYNGRGPVHFRRTRPGRRINVFCNPRFRGLGPAPTTNTGYRKVDAFLYVNRPGLSGAGGCNGAPPRAGTWWPARALMFGRYATNWVRPPRGTRFGFRRRISLCALGAPRRNGKYSRSAPERRCR